MPVAYLASGKSFESPNDVSLLNAAAMAGLSFPYSCKTGRCSTCRWKVISGETIELADEAGLTETEKAQGWILSCVRAARSNLVLEAEDLSGVVLPPSKIHPCRINSLEKLAADVIKVVLRLPPGAGFDFIAGQYVDVIGPGGLRRSYSIANAPRPDSLLELHIRAVDHGAMSDYWFNHAAVNDLLRLHGPQGTFVLSDIAGRELIFLATGTGIAPVKSMLESLPCLLAEQVPKSVTVIWGGRKRSDLYLDLRAMVRHHVFIPVLSRETPSQGERGYVQDAMLRIKADLSNCTVYACGSATMIQSAKATLTDAGLPGHHFHADAFVCSSSLN